MADKTKKKHEFGTVDKVVEVCENCQRIEDKRASDRAKINTLFNGGRPYTADEEEKYHIEINVNWQEGKRIMSDANRQMNNALLHPGLLFSCTLEDGPVDRRDHWSTIVTDLIHRPLQRGRSGKRHYNAIKSRNATVCLHGIGILLWLTDYKWLPRFIAMEDFLLPTDTYCDLTNTRYFAINQYYSPGEFAAMTQGDAVDKHWNQKVCAEILDESRSILTEGTPSTWRDQPEAMREIFKQNKGFYYNDAIPKIRLRSFYFQQVDEPHKWFRSVVLRESVGKVSANKEFLYDSGDDPFADHIDHILNIQYGDGSLVAPFKYHSVRGLGVDLYAPVETNNRLRCEFVQHVFENLKTFFRIADPADRDRLKEVVLSSYGFLPQGLQIVPQNERHQINEELVGAAMGQMKQLMQESSASYVRDVNDAGEKEMTAFEANARLNQANVMVSSMLGNMYLQEGFYYEELLRRFMRKQGGEDPAVKKFQDDCRRAGVPDDMMVAEKWRVSPERVLGGGDRTLAQAQAGWLLQNRPLFGPDAQTKILRNVTSVMLDDPSKAQMYVPDAPPQASQGTYAAEDVFGTLMNGVQVSIRNGIDQIGYVEALLRMMAAVVQRIQQQSNMGTPDELVGLVTVAQNVTQHLMILAGDEKEKQRVRRYSDALGQMTNLIKGFAGRQAQARQAQAKQSGLDPQTQAKAKATIMTAQVKAQIRAQQAQQRQQEQIVQFKLDQYRENMALLADIQRDNLAHKQKLMQEALEAVVGATRQLAMPPEINVDNGE